MLSVHSNSRYLPERSYIFDVIFNEFLGINYQHVIDDTLEKSIHISWNEKLFLSFPDTFFMMPESLWRKPQSLPNCPLIHWNLPDRFIKCLKEETLAIIYGENPETSSHDIPIDIFGSAFFMLSRYEESIDQPNSLDAFGRFPSTASIAYQAGFLDRPIINEYVEILWQEIHRHLPSVSRGKRQFSQVITHDVDRAYRYLGKGFQQMCRRALCDVKDRRSLLPLLKDPIYWTLIRMGWTALDPFNTFDRLMSLSESHNCKSAFYFICGQTSSPNEGRCGNYAIEDAPIQMLMKDISKRGHEIGLHPSFNTYDNPDAIRAELDTLKTICKKNGIQQDILGGRHHYLKFKVPDTWQYWEDAGLLYDSTVSFADRAGFRCGVCYEYSVYNIETRQRLRLKERPLIAMEASVIHDQYMGLGFGDAALDYFKQLKDKCRLFDGEFVLLWHNSFFLEDSTSFQFYENLLNL